MNNLFLNPSTCLREHLGPDAVAAAEHRPASVGQVHLRVGDLPSAHRFYVDQLGFESTAEWQGQALFVSAGKYHHHRP